MGGKRKRCELPRPLPSPTEASPVRGWGPGPLQKPGSPKGAWRVLEPLPPPSPVLWVAPNHCILKIYIRHQKSNLGWEKQGKGR